MVFNAGWLTLILIGAALLIADYYLRRQDAPPHPTWLHWLLGLLGALALLAGIVLLIANAFGLIHTPATPVGLGATPIAAAFLMSSLPGDPAPAPPGGTGGYSWRYVLNAVLVGLTVLSVIGTALTNDPTINAAWLGISETAWHWVLVVFAAATALNTAFNHTPPITAPPTKARLAKVAEARRLLGHDASIH